MDIEAVHTVATGASIVLSYDTVDLMNGVDYVTSNHLAKVISNSWIYTCETPCSDTELPSNLVSSVDSRLAIDVAQGVTILFASGDWGAKPNGSTFGTSFPASDPNVLAVGATNLVLTGCGTTTCSGYGSETGASISGGGYSGYFSEPSWQTSTIGTTSGRAVPDVSMLGYEPGFWVYSTASDMCGTSRSTSAGWFGCAGTSLSTPLWAGFLGIALQVKGGGQFGVIAPLLYELASGSSYSTLFHDVTSGSNGYSAGVGWDPVTGWGTPVANNLAPALSPSPSPSTSTTTSITVLLSSTSTSSTGTTSTFSSIASSSTTTTSQPPLITNTLTTTTFTSGAVAGTSTTTFTSPLATSYSTSTSTSSSGITTQTGLTTARTLSSTTTSTGVVLSTTTVAGTVTVSQTDTFSVLFTTVFQQLHQFADEILDFLGFHVTATPVGQRVKQVIVTTTSLTSPAQVTMTVSYSVVGGGTPTAPTFHYVLNGASESLTLTKTATAVSVDAGSAWSVSPNPLGGSGSSERWYSSQTLAGTASATTIVYSFQNQYYLTMIASGPGRVSPSSGWYNAGANVRIMATANFGHKFESWTGTGSGSFTGTANRASVTMNAAITETATFA